MIAQSPAAIGCFAVLAASLLLTTTSPANSTHWIAEIEGSSMAPTLQGERVVFRCSTCQHQLVFDRETASQRQVLPCDACNSVQLLPENSEILHPDRVVIRPICSAEVVHLGAIVAIDHPLFGQVIKRVSARPAGGYFVTGDNPLESIDSRNPRFGILSHNQIRGIVVKILPSRPLAVAKRSR